MNMAKTDLKITPKLKLVLEKYKIDHRIERPIWNELLTLVQKETMAHAENELIRELRPKLYLKRS